MKLRIINGYWNFWLEETCQWVEMGLWRYYPKSELIEDLLDWGLSRSEIEIID